MSTKSLPVGTTLMALKLYNGMLLNGDLGTNAVHTTVTTGAVAVARLLVADSRSLSVFTQLPIRTGRRWRTRQHKRQNFAVAARALASRLLISEITWQTLCVETFLANSDPLNTYILAICLT